MRYEARTNELFASIKRLAAMGSVATTLAEKEACAADIELASTELVELLEDQRKEEDGPGDNVLLKVHDPITPFTMLDKDAPERYKP